MYVYSSCPGDPWSTNSTDDGEPIPPEHEAFAIVATVLGIVSWFPQIYRLYKTKSSRDLSEPTLIIILTASVCSVTYTFMTVYADNVMVVTAAVINLLVCAGTLALAIRLRPVDLGFPEIQVQEIQQMQEAVI